MLFQIILLIGLITLITSHNHWINDNNDLEIAGGINTEINKFPFQIALLNRGHHKCGGAILNINTILTAAHCTQR